MAQQFRLVNHYKSLLITMNHYKSLLIHIIYPESIYHARHFLLDVEHPGLHCRERQALSVFHVRAAAIDGNRNKVLRNERNELILSQRLGLRVVPKSRRTFPTSASLARCKTSEGPDGQMTMGRSALATTPLLQKVHDLP